jgi:hypothetical protein
VIYLENAKKKKMSENERERGELRGGKKVKKASKIIPLYSCEHFMNSLIFLNIHGQKLLY